MKFLDTSGTPAPQSVLYHRFIVDLATGAVRAEDVPCANLEDVLGGFGRSFQLLEGLDIDSAYDPKNPLIVNTGLLTGTEVMTGLRTYFSAYSPLKCSNQGLPAAMWSAGSGKFGCKMKWAGTDEVIFENRSAKPVLAVIQESDDGPRLTLKPAEHLLGKDTHSKIMALQADYPDAHFAAIGPAGEHYEQVYYGAIAMSTENQLKSGDDKCRFAGRGGMGSLMGYKNLIAIVAQSTDKLRPLTPAVRDLNREISRGAGSRKFRDERKGGLGGTWANYLPLQKAYILPENNFRPKVHDLPERLFRPQLEEQFVIKYESCFRCGINCHKNLYERKADGSKGRFYAKIDFEPLDLLATNLGIHDAEQAWRLVALVDHLGMDSISCGTTVSYILDYNERHPDAPLFNGARFGDFEKVHELIEAIGKGELPDAGHGVKRLSEQLNEPGYAMQVKGLELPAYLPDTNPGYVWAIAGGHMSMATFLLLVLEGETSLDYWVKAITERGLYQIRDDLIGTCKFAGMNHESALQAIEGATGLKLTQEELLAAVRRAYLRGLKLERKQGYADADYTLPAQVFENPNPNLGTPHFITPEFFSALKTRVWEVFDKEIQAL